MGILNLQQTQRQEAARLQQLRESEALRAQLEANQQKIAMFSAQTGRMAEINSESRAEQANVLHEKTLDFQIKQHEDALKNQDAAALANLGAGHSVFVRDGAPQPSPEMLEGPEITTAEGTKTPAFKFAQVKVPGGTYFHKIEDVDLQQKYQKEVLENNKLISEDIYKQEAAKNQAVKAQQWEGDVENFRKTGLDIKMVESSRIFMEKAQRSAELLADQLEKQGKRDDDPKLIARAAALRLNPVVESDDDTKRRYHMATAMWEAKMRNMAQGVPDGTKPQSLTGHNPGEVDQKVQQAHALFGHTLGPRPDELQRSIGNITITQRRGGKDIINRTDYDQSGRPIQSAPALPTPAAANPEVTKKRLQELLQKPANQLTPTEKAELAELAK
jgi:hypothetical protein